MGKLAKGLFLGCLFFSLTASAQSKGVSGTCHFQTVQIHGASTWIYGVNNAGDMVGMYEPDYRVYDGFLLKNGAITSFTWGIPNGINDHDVVVGSYVKPGAQAGASGQTLGFLWRNGTVTPLRYPGSLLTVATAINNQNVVVGYYQDANHNQHGFVYSGGSYQTVDYPGSGSTALNGINNNGTIAGTFSATTGQTNFGFLYAQGDFTEIDYPGQAYSQAAGLNDANQLVGSYQVYNDGAIVNGYLYTGGLYRLLDMPGGPSASQGSGSGTLQGTQLNGINNAGVIVGNFGVEAGPGDNEEGLVVSGCTQ